MKDLIYYNLRYIFTILIFIYVIESFIIFICNIEYNKKYILNSQLFIIYIINFLSFFILFMKTKKNEIVILFIYIIIYITLIQILYKLFYKTSSFLILNHICMLLSISFIVLVKLNFKSAMHQFIISSIGMIIMLIIPYFIKKINFFNKISIFYIICNIFMLFSVLIFGQNVNGAKINITLCNITFQPSEFAKIIFIFFLASQFSKKNIIKNYKYINFITLIVMIHIIILIISKDLGSALIFLITYIIMLYITMNNLSYVFLYIILNFIISCCGYYIFDHVQERIFAWNNPYILYNSSGYQTIQALFGASMSDLFGLGLNKMLLYKIPFVKQDYMFIAIYEQFGLLFVICLILIYINMFILIIKISLKTTNIFYKLLSFGIFIEYAFQIFLTIGGAIKFIPMTGVTLPLISYGGSSLLCAIIMLSIIQGLYILLEIKKEKKIEK